MTEQLPSYGIWTTDMDGNRVAGFTAAQMLEATQRQQSRIAELEADAALGRQMREAIGNESLARFIEKHGEPVPIMKRVAELEAEVQALRKDVEHKDDFAEQIGRDLSKADTECRALRSRIVLSTSQTRVGYMCATDFLHELGEAAGGVFVFADKEDLIAHRGCTETCGVVAVEVRTIDAAMNKEGVRE